MRTVFSGASAANRGTRSTKTVSRFRRSRSPNSCPAYARRLSGIVAANFNGTGLVSGVVQQLDIQEVPLTIEQHTCPEYWCDHCRKPCWAPLPLPIERGGLVGPNLTEPIAFMKGFLPRVVFDDPEVSSRRGLA